MTTAIPDALVWRPKGVPIWVIIVAVIAGVILLSLLIVCLWKVCHCMSPVLLGTACCFRDVYGCFSLGAYVVPHVFACKFLAPSIFVMCMDAENRKCRLQFFSQRFKTISGQNWPTPINVIIGLWKSVDTYFRYDRITYQNDQLEEIK